MLNRKILKATILMVISCLLILFWLNEIKN